MSSAGMSKSNVRKYWTARTHLGETYVWRRPTSSRQRRAKEGRRCTRPAFLWCNLIQSSGYSLGQRSVVGEWGDSNSLSKVAQHAVLHLEAIRVVLDVAVALITVEVLLLVDAGVVVVRERRAASASTRIGAGHVVEDRVYQRSVA